MSDSQQPIVELRNVGYSIDGNKILEDLTLQIAQGEILILLGESGCGKTTTLKLINRLIEPTEGEILVEGKSNSAWNVIELRRHIGYVLQEAGLFPHFTVGENVSLVLKLKGWSEEKKRDRTDKMLEMVGLDPKKFADRFPHELSGGQRQRVGVARALAADPAILLLDEPFGALDPITRSEMQKEFRSLQKRLGKTMVFVTHDVREAFVLGDRIGLMKDGRLLALVPASEFQKLEHPEAKAFAESYA